jgi:hypothetical protein
VVANTPGLEVLLASMKSTEPPIEVHARPITTPAGVSLYRRSVVKIGLPQYLCSVQHVACNTGSAHHVAPHRVTASTTTRPPVHGDGRASSVACVG